MEKKSKISNIIEAFTTKIPENEEWFKERMRICNGCEYNSLNKEASGFVEKLRKAVEGTKAHCTACGCFLPEKPSLPQSECGLSEIGLTPKWHSIGVVTQSSKDWNIFLNSTKVRVYIDDSKEAFIVDYGNIKRETSTTISIILEGEGEVTGVSAGCNCTVPGKPTMLSKGKYMFTSDLNLKVLGTKFKKSIYVETSLGQLTIKLIGKIIN